MRPALEDSVARHGDYNLPCPLQRVSGSDMGSFPLGHGAGPESKEGVCARARDGTNGAEVRGASPAQLAEQVIPFKLELATGGEERRDGARATEFPAVKVITAARRFVVNDAEVRVDRGRGRCSTPEPVELRMVAISTRRSGKDCLREESFPPECDEAARVQVCRMDGPESHVTSREGQRDRWRSHAGRSTTEGDDIAVGVLDVEVLSAPRRRGQGLQYRRTVCDALRIKRFDTINAGCCIQMVTLAPVLAFVLASRRLLQVELEPVPLAYRIESVPRLAEREAEALIVGD